MLVPMFFSFLLIVPISLLSGPFVSSRIPCFVPKRRSQRGSLFPGLGPRSSSSSRVPVLRPLVPSFLIHRFITPSPPRISLNLISTERGGTKNPLKITNHVQGTVLGLPGTGVLPVLRAFCISVTPRKFLQGRWDAIPNPHYYTRGTRLRVCPAVLCQPVFRSIRTLVPT